MMIPQPDGTFLPIPLKDSRDAEETLGVFTYPAGTGDRQLNKMLDEGLDWAWVCYWCRLRLSVPHWWGLVTLSEPPKQVTNRMRKIHYKILGPLGIQRHMGTEFTTLSKKYQGLGMFDTNMDCLVDKMAFGIRFWSLPSTTGKLMMMAYQVFRMDIGLTGNIFTLSYK